MQTISQREKLKELKKGSAPLYFRFRQEKDRLKIQTRWLARKTGIPRKRLQQLESGTAEFTEDEIKRLAEAMGTDLWVDT